MNYIYLITDTQEEFETIAFKNKQDAINYACKMQKIIRQDNDYERLVADGCLEEPMSNKEIKEFYTDCADGECDYSLNGILLKRIKIVLDKHK